VTTFYDIFVGSFIMTLQLLTIIAAVLAACASVGAIGFFGVSFLRGVYLAATGKPMPPKPEQS
jgi:hypothetical protein